MTHTFTYINKNSKTVLEKKKKMKTHLVIPDFFLVVDNGSSKAPSRVNTSPGNGDSGQVNHEHGKPNRQRSQNLSPK